MKPLALVTNDDGIESYFLKVLVEALSEHFRIAVAAPASEQSWIGRALSRRGELTARHDEDRFTCTKDAWAISGTPSDCVNIALGNLLQEKPSIVCSGINIGYNTTEVLILSSGTVAGAIEAATWGLPAIAFSQCVPNELFEKLTENNGQIDDPFSQTLIHSARHAARLSKATLESPEAAGRVVNVNFPHETHGNSETRETVPAKLELGSLFKETSPGKFHFHFNHGATAYPEPDDDRSTLAAGHISRSVLDFSRIGRHSNTDR